MGLIGRQVHIERMFRETALSFCGQWTTGLVHLSGQLH